MLKADSTTASAKEEVGLSTQHAPLLTGRIVHIGKEIGLNVENRLEATCVLDSFPGHCGLTEQQHGLGKMLVDHRIGHRPIF
jgi:hypothetical protein